MDLDGERITIRAGIGTLGGYSAHADQDGLIDFVTGQRRWPSRILIVHGDPDAKQALADALRQRYLAAGRAVSVECPSYDPA